MLALPSKSQIFLNPCLISSSSKVSGQCENPRHVPYALKKQLSKFSTKAWQRKLNSHEGENERQPEGVIASKKFVFYLKITCVSCILLHNSFLFVLISVQFSSVTQSCPALCSPMDCSMPGLPVHHQLPEFTQTHVHWVSDAIQPSHPLSSPSPCTFNLSQHQGLFP